MIINQLKTILLLVILSSLLIGIGGIIGGSTGIHFAFIFALIMNGCAYFFSDRLVLRLYNAQVLDETQYNWIYEIVRQLTHRMQLPMPKLWLVPTPVANAFATGRNPSHASIAVTSGIIDLLDRDELRAVLAHELGHVQNRDILVSTIAATIATTIGYLAHMLQNIVFWSSFSTTRRRSNPIALFMVSLLMPIAATLIQLAISRSREYLADETGAHTCHDPLSLASALEKLHQHIPHAHFNKDDMRKTSTASLFIVHPFSTHTVVSLFSTHPPVHARIARLRTIFEKYFS